MGMDYANGEGFNMSNWDHFFTASDGNRIHYMDTGVGDPVIFTHGYGGGAEPFRATFQQLAPRFRCITFDQRGYGETPLTASAGLWQSAQDMRELIAHLKLESVDIVGYSMGASVLFAYVGQYGCEHLNKVVIGDMTPKLVNEADWKLGLYQGWYTAEDARRDAMVLDAWETEARFLLFYEQVLYIHHPEEARTLLDPLKQPEEFNRRKTQVEALCGPGFFAAIPVATNRYYMKSMAESDFRDVLRRITVPSLLVYASPGSIYTEETGRYVESQIPNTCFYRMENASHAFTPEQNERYLQQVCAFLQGTTDATRE